MATPHRSHVPVRGYALVVIVRSAGFARICTFDYCCATLRAADLYRTHTTLPC